MRLLLGLEAQGHSTVEVVGRAAQRLRPILMATYGFGSIGLACALGYLDLRFEGAWRRNHPRLVDWLETFAARTPTYEATRA